MVQYICLIFYLPVYALVIFDIVRKVEAGRKAQALEAIKKLPLDRLPCFLKEVGCAFVVTRFNTSGNAEISVALLERHIASARSATELQLRLDLIDAHIYDNNPQEPLELCSFTRDASLEFMDDADRARLDSYEARALRGVGHVQQSIPFMLNALRTTSNPHLTGSVLIDLAEAYTALGDDERAAQAYRDAAKQSRFAKMLIPKGYLDEDF